MMRMAMPSVLLINDQRGVGVPITVDPTLSSISYLAYITMAKRICASNLGETSYGMVITGCAGSCWGRSRALPVRAVSGFKGPLRPSERRSRLLDNHGYSEAHQQRGIDLRVFWSLKATPAPKTDGTACARVILPAPSWASGWSEVRELRDVLAGGAREPLTLHDVTVGTQKPPSQGKGADM